jgi:hypothetical protein
MKYFLALFILMFFALPVSAQLCGSYGVTISVYDNDLKPVEAYVTEVIPLAKDELRSAKFEPVADTPGASELKLFEGHMVAEKYKLIVSAPGFQSFEKTLTFPHCTRLSYDILLVKAWQKRAVTSGKITDENGAAVPYAGVTFAGADKTERFVSSDSEGCYELRLKPGDYVVEARKMYHHITKVEKLVVPAYGRALLDLKMKTQKYDEDKQVIIQ